MKSLESQGKTVDEAIFRGLDQMGLSIDEVDIEIVQEGGKGFLGIGAKQCIVRLTERQKDDVERILQEQAAALAREREEKAQRAQERRAERAERPQRKAHVREDGAEMPVRNQKPHRSSSSDDRRSRRGNNRRPHSENEALPTRSIGEPCDGGEEAVFLREVLSRMGLNATVECFQDESCLYMRVSGENMGILIGRRGDTLNALQYLTSLVANRKDGPYRRIVVDTENYRTKRDQTLVRLAKRMADEVSRTGKPISMEPMNPYERRILHSTLQNHPSVTTYSEGEEPQRRVVIASK